MVCFLIGIGATIQRIKDEIQPFEKIFSVARKYIAPGKDVPTKNWSNGVW